MKVQKLALTGTLLALIVLVSGVGVQAARVYSRRAARAA